MRSSSCAEDARPFAIVALASSNSIFVLLAGDAGLRAGEIRGLHWSSVDLRHRRLTVERSEYKGEFTTPKHDKIRTIPLTKRLARSLSVVRDSQRALVLVRDDGRPISRQIGRDWLGKAQREASLRSRGPHTLRHTFCSHLAMRGAAARVIQQLAGHSSLVTTQRYMHLSPGAAEAAIALLEDPPPRLEPTDHASCVGGGDMLETTAGRSPQVH